jgi:hypothetical protein
MASFFRVIELHDGQWACRHGRHEYDSHPLLDEAIDHIAALAARNDLRSSSFIGWTALSRISESCEAAPRSRRPQPAAQMMARYFTTAAKTSRRRRGASPKPRTHHRRRSGR